MEAVTPNLDGADLLEVSPRRFSRTLIANVMIVEK
jgi:hypothetical protein